MAFAKTEYEHTITANGSSYDTLDKSNGGNVALGTQTGTKAPIGLRQFQMVASLGVGTGATVSVEVRNGAGGWLNVATKVFAAGDTTADFEMTNQWAEYRFTTSGFSATNIKVYVTIG